MVHAILTALPEVLSHNVVVTSVMPVLIDGIVGLLAGFMVLMVVTTIQKLKR